MIPLAVELARQHGGTVLEWRRRLDAAGVPGDVPRARLTAAQRKALTLLLGAPRSAPEPVAPSWLTWARWAVNAYLLRCEPWRLPSADANDSLQRWSEATLLGMGQAEVPPEPAVPLLPPEALMTGPIEWAQTSDTGRRSAALVAILTTDLTLQRAVQPLVPGPRGHGWPRRLVLRMASGGGVARDALALPPGIAARAYGAEERWFLAAAPTIVAQRPDERPAVTPRHGAVVRLPPPAEDVPELVLHPDTEAALVDLRRRKEHVARVMALGLPQFKPGTLALFAGESGYGKRTAARRIVHAMGLELHQVQAGLLGSRWLGESEAMMSAVFNGLAPDTSAVLIEDAQDLLSERTTVVDSASRYTNMATNHLLQLLDDWPGLAIFTGAGVASFDPAVRRRFGVIASFPPLDLRLRTTLVARWIEAMAARDPQRVRVAPEHYLLLAQAADGMAPGAIVRALLGAALDTPLDLVLDGPRLIAAFDTLAERRGAARRA